MSTTIKGCFPSRREAELAVEHLVQEYGIDRSDIAVEPAGDANSTGGRVAGADAESGHPGQDADASGAAYEGALFVTVDVNADEKRDVEQAFADAGATNIDSI